MNTGPIAPSKEELATFFDKFPFFQLLGMKLLDIEPGKARLAMNYRHDLCQPAGIMHGGAIASLVDTAIAHAILLTDRYRVASQRGALLVSVDLRIKYIRPVSEGQVICDATITRMGRQIIHADSIVVNEAGKEVARGDSIYMIVDKSASAG